MSTITDAVNKKKHEDEAKRSKTVDLDNPPRIDIPRDWQKIRRRIFRISAVLIIASLCTAGYIYRVEIRLYLASIMPRSIKGTVQKPSDDNQERTNDPDTTSAHNSTDQTNTEGTVDLADKGPEVEKGPFPELNIGGIFHDPLEPEVLIRGRWLKTGETIDGVEIKEILRDGVRVMFNGEERTIHNR